jgi:hypothetical protein
MRLNGADECTMDTLRKNHCPSQARPARDALRRLTPKLWASGDAYSAKDRAIMVKIGRLPVQSERADIR